MLGDDRRKDVRLLLLQIERVRVLLTWLVFESSDFDALRNDFERAYRDVGQRLDRLEAELGRLQEAPVSALHEREQVPDFRQLEEAGLAGEQLRLKDKLFDWLVEGGARRVKWLLGWANSLLGSLVSVYGWLEPVREFKEGVELVVVKQRWPKEPPTSIFPPRSGA